MLLLIKEVSATHQLILVACKIKGKVWPISLQISIVCVKNIVLLFVYGVLVVL